MTLLIWFCPCGEMRMPAEMVTVMGDIHHRNCGPLAPLPPSPEGVEHERKS